MTIFDEIKLDCKAKFPILYIQTSEETRLGKILKKIADDLDRNLICWTSTDGLKTPNGEAVGAPGTTDISRMLDEVKKYPNPAIVFVKDPHKFLDEIRINRKFRDLYHELKGRKKTMVICSPVMKIPEELSQEITIVDFPFPEETELGLILDEAIGGLKETAEDGDEKAVEVLKIIEKQNKEHRDEIIRAMLGLTSETAENIVSKCIANHSLDINVILQEKQQAIRKSGLLEFYPTDRNLVEVGGLDNLKRWLKIRQKTFGQEAVDYGLPAPKGVVLVGLPGTGKSLVAKALASMWGLPLIRLDVGSLFGSLVGQSEERTRKALAMAESVSPAILWVDEVEKAFSFGSGDNGTSQRVFASILTWMQEKKKPCFLIATANNIAALPPELQRKGRFDEIFFLDLPNDKEREEIFKVHLKRFKYGLKDFEFPILVKESDTMVGAEIEQSIIDAMYVAFDEGKRKIKTADIVATLKKIVPQSKSNGEQITALRNWLKEGRAISASASVEDETKNKRKVEL